MSTRFFVEFFILDSEGNEITSTAFREHESFNWKQEYFATAVEEETYHSRVFIGENQLPAMFIVQSIRKLGDLAGFLCAEVDLKNIWDLVDSITIGKEGNAFVVSSNGKLIAYKEKKRVFEQEDLSHIDVVTKVIQGEEGTAIFNTISGERVIGAYAFIQSLGWGIIIQQPIDEAFALARQQIFQVIIGMIISILVAVWIGIFMTRRIINPIKDLVIGAQRFADGDLAHRLEVYTNDELGILAEEFNIMAKKLSENQQKLRRAERLATLSKFAAMVSHEIRNPLNAISINMQVLKREFLKKKQNVESQLKYYDIVASEVKRVDNLINDFLTLSRPPRPNLKRQNLHQILDEVIISQQARALNQGARVERRYIEEEVRVNIDVDQIKQVFLNVILNSLEAIQGGGKLTIITQFDFTGTQTSSSIVKPLENSAVYITFQDTGSGIPQDKLKDVFEFYFTTKKKQARA